MNGRIATTEIDQRAHSVTVHLAGEATPKIAAAKAAAPKDVTVNIETAKYSMAEMQAAGLRIHKAWRSGKLPKYATIVSNNDGSGLTVELPTDSLAKSAAADLKPQFQNEAAMDIAVAAGEAITPTTRGDDASPWRAGAQIRNPNGGICSTAFAVVRPDGYGRILSASHCDFTGNLSWDDYSGDAFTPGGGSVSIDRVPYDTMIMDPTGGTQGRSYGGAWNEPSSGGYRYSLKVAASDGSHVGDYICPSGANSGEHCGVRVTELGVQWLCGINQDPAAPCGGHRARRDAIAPATVGGDSGGPVYETRPDGRVNALGVIFGGSESVACGSTRFATSKCYRTMVYPAIRPILDYWNVELETVQ